MYAIISHMPTTPDKSIGRTHFNEAGKIPKVTPETGKPVVMHPVFTANAEGTTNQSPARRPKVIHPSWIDTVNGQLGEAYVNIPIEQDKTTNTTTYLFTQRKYASKRPTGE